MTSVSRQRPEVFADYNNDKGISALGLDSDLGYSRRHQGHDDDDNEDKNNEVEDNEKDDNNNKVDNNDKRISALGLDADLEFLSSGSPGFS